MPDLSTLGTSAAIVLVAVVLLWFAFGTQRNIRIGNDVLRWLQGALPLLGRRTTMRWLGSSAVELRIAEAIAPFRDVTVHVVLEPRDVGFLWAWGRLRGRRDFLILRANLTTPPRFGVEAWDPRGWTSRLATDEDDWQRIAWPGEGIEAMATSGADTTPVRLAWEAIDRSTAGVWRLAVQPVVPHVVVHVRPPARDVPAERMIEPIRQLAGTLTARP